MIKIQRALISVTDKTNLRELAEILHAQGTEIISTGGTGAFLTEAGIPFTEISTVTGNPEAFGGRMKTISFNIESALLFDREKDAAEAAKLKIQPIDLVVCNLYAFEKYREAGTELSELIHHIDIGGPTMIRAAAKNFKYVAVVTDIHDYDSVISELRANAGALGYETRKRLMAKAFNLTADYDAAIAQAMDSFNGADSLRLSFTGGKTLRYGENSHQQASLYRLAGKASALYDMEVLHGMEVSYNNILDVQAAIETVSTFSHTGCVIVKHNNPCGMAEGKSQRRAFELAWEGDTVSAFGGIIAFNTEATLEAVSYLAFDAEDKSKRKFVEIVAAPSFADDALAYLKQQKNLRIIRFLTEMIKATEELRVSNNTLLRQSKDDTLYSKMESVTETLFDIEKQKDLAAFGLRAVQYIKSNAIALVMRTAEDYLQLIGMGSGQPNRVNSVGLAVAKAKKNLGVDTLAGIDVLLVSDAFFPFEDNIDLAHEAGIAKIIQPGGSIRDKHVIARCNELGVSMALTGCRHFKH